MKPLITVYCEGSETKLAVLSHEKEGIKLLKTLSVSSLGSTTKEEALEPVADFSMEDMGDDISFENFTETENTDFVDSSEISVIANGLSEFKLSQAQFLPVITEPTLNYHIFDGPKQSDKSKTLDAIITDIEQSKGTLVPKDYIDYMDFSENSIIAGFIEGSLPCVEMIEQVAAFNEKRFYKIPTIKCSELSLAYYVSKTTKFFPEDFSLIIYTGKEYSKLIFLEGQSIKHIGSTLDIGTQNLQTYDVYFSKILLEMENGGIPRLDNVILCGEDNSENLILSFYGTFPEANVSELKFDAIDLSAVDEETSENVSSFTIPIAAALEYFDEEKKLHSGINLLPAYIKENQKFLQFGWHSYVMLPILFAVTFFFTFKILSNMQEIDEKDKRIAELNGIIAQNQLILDQINPLSEKIANFDRTLAILDSASYGTELYWQMLEKVSDFIERRRNFWVTDLKANFQNNVDLTGYSLSRSVLTEFADYNNSSLLQNVKYDPLRDKNAFQYNLKFNLTSTPAIKDGP